MVAGCGNKCVKYFFWLINFLFFVAGIAILAISIWMRLDSSMMGKVTVSVRLNTLPTDSINLILYGLMAIGAILLILGFLGCCGSVCESLCAIGLYFLLVIALFVVKIVAIVLYFVKKDTIRDYFNSAIRDQFVRNYYVNQDYRTIMDQLQNGLQCCGGYGSTDYTNYGLIAPNTCPATYVNNYYVVPGCGTKLWSIIESNLIIVLVIIFAILVVQLFAMILACIMCGAVKDKRNQSY